MAAKRKDKGALYKTAEANKMGLGGGNGKHGASRNPVTGLMFKLPGHQTVNLAAKADREMGYRTVQRGTGLASYEKNDPSLHMGSVSAPRDTDISGAIFNSETIKAIQEGKAPRTAAQRAKGK